MFSPLGSVRSVLGFVLILRLCVFTEVFSVLLSVYVSSVRFSLFELSGLLVGLLFLAVLTYFSLVLCVLS